MLRIEAKTAQPPLVVRGIEKVLRSGEGHHREHLRKVAKQIVRLEEHYDWMSDKELQDEAANFRRRLQEPNPGTGKVETLNDILPEAFAVVREVTHRVLGMKQYEEQIMTGLALHSGAIAEMKTGEGKTLAAIMPAYLHALTGEPVHIATANDYLAERDTELLKPVYEALGLSVGVILPDNPDDPLNRHTAQEHKAAYECDVTYGTITEFGLDYLRDNMVLFSEDRVQRNHGFLIVDEADAVLIDEARTPLIVERPVGEHSGGEHPVGEQETKWYREFARLTDRMIAGMGNDDVDANDPEIQELVDFVVNEKRHTVEPTERGIRFVEDQLGIDDLYDQNNSFLVSYLYNAMKADTLFTKDKDYIVDRERDEVHIVNQFTGRTMYGRRFHEGLHQALEAKEGITVRPDNETLAEISIQNYVGLYAEKSGMTGTAESDAKEFSKTYKMDVVKIPTHLPSQRIDHEPIIYKTEQAKFDGVADEIWERYQTGQPILVGTVSVEKSEQLSAILSARNIPHKVLNAKNHAEEATIIAEGGRRGSVIISTNMAGRGVDIKLGGDAEYLAEDALTQKYLTAEEHAQPGLVQKKVLLKKAHADEYNALVSQYKQQTEVEAQVVKAAGGLYVIGTELHESKRIDNQLRGRAGRQGDPGETRFFLSLEDSVVQMAKPAVVAQLQAAFAKVPDLYPIHNKRVLKTFLSAQQLMEERNFQTRRDVVDFDNVLNVQRKLVYEERNKILEAEDVQQFVDDIIVDVVSSVMEEKALNEYGELDMDRVWKEFEEIYPLTFSPADVKRETKSTGVKVTANVLKEKIIESLFRAYGAHIKDIVGKTDERYYTYYPRQILMAALELQWKDHLTNMNILQDSVQLRQYASRDPKIEYSKEGLEEFSNMRDAFKRQVVKQLFITKIAS
jgi:preprotein translocase subunit SecA